MVGIATASSNSKAGSKAPGMSGFLHHVCRPRASKCHTSLSSSVWACKLCCSLCIQKSHLHTTDPADLRRTGKWQGWRALPLGLGTLAALVLAASSRNARQCSVRAVTAAGRGMLLDSATCGAGMQADGPPRGPPILGNLHTGQ